MELTMAASSTNRTHQRESRWVGFDYHPPGIHVVAICMMN